MAEWFLFLPQVRLGIDEIVERARVAEDAGFDGIAFIDHLEAPGAPDRDIWDATAIAAWVAAQTQRLRVGHLVLCDGFRHPAVLAKHAVTMSAASGGRFELGLGAGSMPAEFERFGFADADDAPARFRRLERDLALIRQYWGDDGDIGDNAQFPRREHPIPLVLGGVGKKTMELVRRHADWWSLPCNHLDRLEQLRPHAGDARVSVQQMVGFVGSGADRATVTETSARRFGYLGDGLRCGTSDELIDHFGRMRGLGAERFYVWFADFAQPDTLREFAETVVKAT